jgi:hypothetical protein
MLSVKASCFNRSQSFPTIDAIQKNRRLGGGLPYVGSYFDTLNPDGRVGATRIVPSDGSALAAAALASESGAFHVTR